MDSNRYRDPDLLSCIPDSKAQGENFVFVFGFWFVCLFFQYPATGARSVIAGQLCWRLFHILNYRKLDILSQASLEINFKIFV